MEVFVLGDPTHDGLAGFVVEQVAGVEVADAGGELLERHVGETFGEGWRLGHLTALHLRHAPAFELDRIDGSSGHEVAVDHEPVTALFGGPAAHPLTPGTVAAEHPLDVAEVVRQVVLGEHVDEQGAANRAEIFISSGDHS